jgi:hypothetical protein
MTYTDDEIDEIIKFCGKRPTSSVSEPDGSVTVDYDIHIEVCHSSIDGFSSDLYIPLKTFRRILKEKEFQEAYEYSQPGIKKTKEFTILLYVDRKDLPKYLNENNVCRNLALLRIKKGETR